MTTFFHSLWSLHNINDKICKTKSQVMYNIDCKQDNIMQQYIREL